MGLVHTQRAKNTDLIFIAVLQRFVHLVINRQEKNIHVVLQNITELHFLLLEFSQR